jgi:hypothetical protein
MASVEEGLGDLQARVGELLSHGPFTIGIAGLFRMHVVGFQKQISAFMLGAPDGSPPRKMPEQI